MEINGLAHEVLTSRGFARAKEFYAALLPYLGLTPVQFLNQLFESLTMWDVFGGTIKAIVFAIAITLIACQRGLSTRGGAAGVGSSTTSAVVLILFHIWFNEFSVEFRVRSSCSYPNVRKLIEFIGHQ